MSTTYPEFPFSSSIYGRKSINKGTEDLLGSVPVGMSRPALIILRLTTTSHIAARANEFNQLRSQANHSNSYSDICILTAKRTTAQSAYSVYAIRPHFPRPFSVTLNILELLFSSHLYSAIHFQKSQKCIWSRRIPFITC